MTTSIQSGTPQTHRIDANWLCPAVILQWGERNVKSCLFYKGNANVDLHCGYYFFVWCTFLFPLRNLILSLSLKSLKYLRMHQVVDGGLKEASVSRGRTDWHYRLRIMSSMGKEIIAWRWLREWWENILHADALRGWCPWKPAMAMSHQGLTVIMEAGTIVEGIRKQLGFFCVCVCVFQSVRPSWWCHFQPETFRKTSC